MLLQAQSPLEGDYLFLGLGAAKPIQIDQFHSPLHYHGYAASAQLGWHSYKGKWMSNLDIGGSAGLSNPYEFGTTLNSSIDLGARLHYSLRYRFWQEGKNHYLKPVVLLTNARCYSATNTFTALTKSLDQFLHVGDTTGGGGGIPADYELPNGWNYRFSVSRSFLPNGFNIEHGLPPDTAFDLDPTELASGKDGYIDYALSTLR